MQGRDINSSTMTTERQRPQIRVFFVQGRPGFSASTQYELGREHGLVRGGKLVYEPDAKNNAEDLAAAIRAAGRWGKIVGMIGGFRPFGESRTAMMAGYAQAKALGGIIVDPLTGHRSDQDSAEMLDAALKRLHREKAEPPEGYDEIGRRGAEGRWKAIHGERVPKKTAKKAWHDHKQFETDWQVANFLGAGWSLATLRREFKSSGRARGRRKLTKPQGRK
jgi:hypothetical protein